MKSPNQLRGALIACVIVSIVGASYARGQPAKTDGTLLAKLDALGIANNTIVVYGTDNGPHANTWPDGATTPFRSEKNTNWEGVFRVPFLIRWPGRIKPGVSNEIMSHLDWMPTLLALFY